MEIKNVLFNIFEIAYVVKDETTLIVIMKNKDTVPFNFSNKAQTGFWYKKISIEMDKIKKG